MEVRKAIKLKDKALIDLIVNMKEDDVSSTFIFELFGEFDGDAKCRPYDIIDIPPGSYGKTGKKNKNTFTTTVGRYVFNKYFIERDLFDLFGYIDDNIGSKQFDTINSDLSYALMEDKISIDVLKHYLLKTQKFMPFITIISPNHSEKLLTCSKIIGKKKAELIAKYKDELAAGDIVIAEKIQDELLKFAVDYLGDDPALDSFISGARGSINNNFKNMFVMKGAVRDPNPNATQEYNIATSNYIDGISKEEYSLYANSLAAGPYSRGKKTQAGGYWEGLFGKGMQHLKIDDPGTDCGTTRTITATITDKNINRFMYNWIVSGSNLVELTSENKDKYIGKTVKMRFSSLCEHETICSKCAGNMFYRLGIRNVGLVTQQIPSILKNKSMKLFHDSSVTTTEMDPMKAFGLK